MDKRLNFQGTSVIESVVATLIIVLSFTIGTIIFNNVFSNNQIALETRISAICDTILEETKQKKLYLDDILELEGIKIIKTITKYQTFENALLVELEAFQEEKKVFSIREIIKAEQND